MWPAAPLASRAMTVHKSRAQFDVRLKLEFGVETIGHERATMLAHLIRQITVSKKMVNRIREADRVIRSHQHAGIGAVYQATYRRQIGHDGGPPHRQEFEQLHREA